jgi:hypothetical protein
MAVNGTDVLLQDSTESVEQIRGRMKFYHVGDPVRRDMDRICGVVDRWVNHASEPGGTHTTAYIEPTSAQVVGAYLDENDIKLLPWQRKRLGLGSKT